jgi:hypothetical protein
MKALEKIPVELQRQLAEASMKVRDDAAAIYGLLDKAGAPVKVEQIQKELNITPYAYRNACRLLRTTAAEVYPTQEGVVLKKYVTEDEKRYWHLAWSLGLFELSGHDLTLDRDLLKRVPEALEKLREEGKLKQENTLNHLRRRTRESVAILVDVLDMYREVNRMLEVSALPEITGSDWKRTFAKIKKEVKALPAGSRFNSH